MRSVLAVFLLSVGLVLGVAMLWFGWRSRQAPPPVVVAPAAMAAPIPPAPAPLPAATKS